MEFYIIHPSVHGFFCPSLYLCYTYYSHCYTAVVHNGVTSALFSDIFLIVTTQDDGGEVAADHPTMHRTVQRDQE